MDGHTPDLKDSDTMSAAVVINGNISVQIYQESFQIRLEVTEKLGGQLMFARANI